MAATSVEELYTRYIKPLPTSVRLRLVAIITRDLADLAGTTNRADILPDPVAAGAGSGRQWGEIQGIANSLLVERHGQEWQGGLGAHALAQAIGGGLDQLHVVDRVDVGVLDHREHRSELVELFKWKLGA